MKAKIYNKKKLFSLLILPFMASTITAKSTLAASTELFTGIDNHISGTHDSYRIFSYDSDVTVILDAAAQINNDEAPPAVSLQSNSSVDMQAGSMVTTTDSSSPAVLMNYGATVNMETGSEISSTNDFGYAYAIRLDNEGPGSYGEVTNQVTMNQAAIEATASLGSAAGIFSGTGDNDENSAVTTSITLDNSSSIKAFANGVGGNKYAVGIYHSGHSFDSPLESTYIALDHGSSITAESTVTGGTAMANGIDTGRQGETRITLSNSSTIDVTATATTTGATIAKVDNTYGIYVQTVKYGDSVVSMDLGSAITGIANATADKYTTVQENTGIQLWNGDDGDVSVTLANGSSITSTTTATIRSGERSYSTNALIHDSYGIYAYSHGGNTDVSMNGGATIMIDATAINNNAGAKYDQALVSDVYGIHAYSEYGDTTVTLNNLSAVSATARATAQDHASASVHAIYAGAGGLGNDPYAYATVALTMGFGNDPYGNATVALTMGSSVSASADATSTDDWADVHAFGIVGYSRDGVARVDLDSSSVTVNANATGHKYAGAEGLGIFVNNPSNYLYSGAIVNLETATVVVNATAASTSTEMGLPRSEAGAVGIYALGAEGASVLLADSSITATATATAIGANDANAFGDGIDVRVRNNTAAITLDNSTINATATASSSNSSSPGNLASAYASVDGIEIYGPSQAKNITLTDSQVNATAAATAYLAGAEGFGIIIEAYNGASYNTDTIAVTLDHTAVTTKATTTAIGISELIQPSAKVGGIDLNGAAEIAVLLSNGSSLNTTAIGTNTVGDMAAWAYGVEINASSLGEYGQLVNPTTESLVTLDNSTISAVATSTSADNATAAASGIDGLASARAISGGSYFYANSGADSTVDLTSATLTVAATATGNDQAEATAQGIDNIAYATSTSLDGAARTETGNFINLDSSKLDSQAKASGANWTKAYAGAIHTVNTAHAVSTKYGSYSDSAISIELLNNSTVNTLATATSTSGDAWAEAVGIYADSNSYADAQNAWNGGEGYADVSITLDNARLSTTANATGENNGEAATTAIRVNSNVAGHTDNTYARDESSLYIDLANTTLSAAASFTGYSGNARATGIETNSQAAGYADSYFDGERARSYTEINLDTVTLSATATATAATTSIGDSAARASAITAIDSAEGGSRFANSKYAENSSSVSINLDTASVSATATAKGGDAYADAVGIYAYSNSEAYAEHFQAEAGSNVNITLDNSTLAATAVATGSELVRADAIGINAAADANSYSDTTNSYSLATAGLVVELSGATLNVAAIATSTDEAGARSQGVYADARSNVYSRNPAYSYVNNTVSLDNSTLTSLATATGPGKAQAYAGGINAQGYSDSSWKYDSYSDSELNISLSNSSITVRATANASAAGAEGYAKAVGIRADTYAAAYSYDYDWGVGAQGAQVAQGAQGAATITVNLDNSSVVASATGGGDDTGDKYYSGASATAIMAIAGADSYGHRTYASIYPYDNDTESQAPAILVDLNNSTVSAAAGFTGNYGQARATAIDTVSWAEADTGNHYEDKTAYSLTEINLDHVTLSANATATGDNNYATAYGIDSYVGAEGGAHSSYRSGDTYADATIDISLNAANISAIAVASGAEGYTNKAVGIDAYSYAYAYAGRGEGDYSAFAAATVNIDLNDSSVIASATATGDGSNKRALAHGINAYAYSDSYKYDTYAESAAIITLDNSSVSATATANGEYASARAYAVMASATANNGSYSDEMYSSAAVSIELTDSGVNATASANGCYGYAMATGIYADSDSDRFWSKYGNPSTSINLTNSRISSSATANGEYGNATATGIYASVGELTPVSISLTDSSISAVAVATGIYGGARAVGIDAYGGGYSDPEQISISLDNAGVTASASGGAVGGFGVSRGIYASAAGAVIINLSNGSSLNATASGDDRFIPEARLAGSFATGIEIYNVGATTINIDETSSVNGDDYAIRAVSGIGAATVNNDGHIAGRLNVTTLNNSATGTLQATLSGNDDEWISDSVIPLVQMTPYYFYATDSATLAPGATFRLATSDDLGFTSFGQVKEYRLLGVGSEIIPEEVPVSGWDPETLNIVKYGYQSPLLQFDYDEELSDPDHIIIKVKLLTPTEAGLTGSAGAAALAALNDGLFDFNSDPEQWSPEIMSKVFGTMQFIHGNLFNIENRLRGKRTGENSGDPTAANHAWINVNYTDATQDKRDNIEGFDTQTTAFNLGYDRNLSANALLGLSFGYGNTDAETELNHRTLDMDAYILSLYGQFVSPGWFSEAQLSAGWGSNDLVRNVGATNYTASFDSSSYYARVAGGMNIEAGDWAVMPKASLDYATITFDDYRETGGPLALTVNSDSYSSSNVGAGLMVVNKGRMITPEFGAMLYYDLIGDTIQTSSRFNAGATYFQTNGADPARTSWELSAGLTFEAPDTPLTFKVGYDMLGREDFIAHNFSGKLTFDF